jgi:hypothetical protein
MKIPISLTYKYFSETITIKKKVDDMHIGETMEMYKNLMIPIFGEESYNRVIINMADSIKQKRKSPIKKILSYLNEPVF